MIDYSSWERHDFSPINLNLDARNPRVPDRIGGETDQSSLMALLVGKYDVFGLAKSIVEKGYFPDSIVFVLKEDKNNVIVLEGNRRVAALKLLLNPDSAPDKERAKLRKLAESVNKKLIQKIPAIVAPTRADVAPILIGKHTYALKAWSVLMKAAFIQEMLHGSNGSNEAVAARWDMSLPELNRFVKMGKMYHLACTLDLPAEISSKLYDKEKFSITTVERLIGNPEVREALGISQDLERISDIELFKKRYGKLIADICSGKDSRSFDEVGDRERYAKELRDQIPEASGKKGTRGKTTVKVSEILKTAEETEGPRAREMTLPKPRSVRTSSSIIPVGVKFRLHNASALKALFDEIKSLRVSKYKNVSVIALRILLEKSLKKYLKAHKVETVSDGKNQVSVSDATLFPLLQYIGAKNGTLIKDAAVRKRIRDFANAADYPSLSTLNAIVHNEEYSFSEGQARNLWPPLETLFTIMLEEAGGSGGQLQGTPSVSGGKKSTS